MGSTTTLQKEEYKYSVEPKIYSNRKSIKLLLNYKGNRYWLRFVALVKLLLLNDVTKVEMAKLRLCCR